MNENVLQFWYVTVIIATDVTLYLLTVLDALKVTKRNFSFIFFQNIHRQFVRLKFAYFHFLLFKKPWLTSSARAAKNSVVKKLFHMKERLKLFRVTLYNFSISYFVLEILRFVWYVNDPNYDITLHNELLKTLVYLWDYETKSLKMMHVHGCIPQHQPCKSSSDLIL